MDNPFMKNCYNPENYREGNANRLDYIAPPTHRSEIQVAKAKDNMRAKPESMSLNTFPETIAPQPGIREASFEMTADKFDKLPSAPAPVFASEIMKKPAFAKADCDKDPKATMLPPPCWPTEETKTCMVELHKESNQITPRRCDMEQPIKQAVAPYDMEQPIKQTSFCEEPAKKTSIDIQSPMARKGVTETRAKPGFARADDYRWLNGQVRYDSFSKAWRLRYAPLDEEDAYGGSVTLVDDGTLGKLKDGQFIRVHGSLMCSREKAVRPRYKVISVQAIEEKD